jgi:hypothetical protein
MNQILEVDCYNLHDDGLLEVVALLRKAFPTSRLAAGASWSSPKVLLDSSENPQALNQIARAIRQGCEVLEHPNQTERDWSRAEKTWDVCGWANVMRQGDLILSHDHSMSHLGGRNAYAAVFYLDDSPTRIHFSSSEGDRIIAPRAKQLLVFPATLVHSVEKHEIAEERISFAFNIRRTT